MCAHRRSAALKLAAAIAIALMGACGGSGASPSPSSDDAGPVADVATDAAVESDAATGGTAPDGTALDSSLAANPAVWRTLTAKPSPVDNPLKGFIPYRGTYAFPHSLEWFYVPLRDLMSGPAAFTFDTGLEAALNEIAARGHQAVFRVYLDYPSLPTGVPQFLIDGGLLMRPYSDYGGGQSPDYENQALVAALDAFIAAFGSRYDGDPRIGFITEGLLGFWGEWHTFPHDAWFASTATQNRVLHAFTRGFSRTRLLVRRPAADSATLPVGYHDDSFAYETLPPTGWHFWPLVVAAGQADIWKTQPIGGELRPEIQSSVFDVPPSSPDDYGQCVTTTHASWLINQTAFAPSFTGAKLDRAVAGSAMLGYDLRATAARVSIPHDGSPVRLDVQVSNAGVAPFYYDWPVDVAVLSGATIVASWHPLWKLTTILPGAVSTVSTQSSVPGLTAGGPYTMGVRVPNVLPQGLPLRFGNAEQEAVWLRLAP